MNEQANHQDMSLPYANSTGSPARASRDVTRPDPDRFLAASAEHRAVAPKDGRPETVYEDFGLINPGDAIIQAALDGAAQAWARALVRQGQSRTDVDPSMIRPGLATIVNLMIVDRRWPSRGESPGSETSPLASSAHAVGAMLVEANLTDPQVLSTTIEVLGQSVRALMAGREAECHPRFVQALGGLAAGFAGALHTVPCRSDRTSTSQLWPRFGTRRFMIR